jgi:hypothetical protein
MTEQALRSTSLAGILFFFPLRVAGARSRSSVVNQARILIMLKEVRKRNFVVADAFVEDLENHGGAELQPHYLQVISISIM